MGITNILAVVTSLGSSKKKAKIDSNEVDISLKMQKQNNSLIILLSILLFISLVIVGFFAYQTQKLVNELRVTRDELKQTPTAMPISDPTIDWKIYKGYIFEYKYPNNLYLFKNNQDNIELFTNKNHADEASNCIKNKLDTIDKPCQFPLIQINVNNNTDLSKVPNLNSKDNSLIKYVNYKTQSGIDLLINEDLIGGEGASAVVEAYLILENKFYLINISTTPYGYEKTLRSFQNNANIDGNDSFDEKELLYQILSTFKFLEDEIPAISATELQKGWYWGNVNQKKINTPSDWVFKEAGRSSCWHEVGVLCQ